jgi:hypothetical protein
MGTVIIIVITVPVKIPTFTILESHTHTHNLHDPSTQTNNYYPVKHSNAIYVTTLELLKLMTNSVVKTGFLDLHISGLGKGKCSVFGILTYTFLSLISD